MLNQVTIDEIVARTLQEDLHSGDLTTEAMALGQAQSSATATAKSPLVVCGGELFRATFQRLDPNATFSCHLADGESAGVGNKLWTIQGRADALLMAERSALNLAQRLSGIATQTRQFVDQLPAGSKTRIADTRKTTPGLRALERYAVRMGGGHNHRDNLGAAVMIKDNHIAACGSISQAVKRARAYAPHTATIEVEVADTTMLDEALAAGADIIMLDNFEDNLVAAAVERCAKRAIIEVSGNMTLSRITSLAQAGVDVISIGALTHSVAAADISLRFEQANQIL